MCRFLNKKIILSFTLSFIVYSNLFSQRVGLVLSGGGAQGLVHIGVLKALEEKKIPISYITGTSMGALVGGLYASGYTIKEIEIFFTSPAIKNIVTGNIPQEKTFYFKKRDINPSWISRYIDPLNLQETYLPTNLISPFLIDIELLKLCSGASQAANYNFDNLLIPFRCVASDVESKEQVVFSNGNLAMALRASMAYPFFFKPLNYNGHLLYDGGMYNNFPSDVMYKEFKPDVIIGSNVSTNPTSPTEENIYSQVRAMLMRKTDFTVNYTKGILLNMDVKGGLLDFDNAKEIIDIGYNTTIKKIDSIYTLVPIKSNIDSINFARNKFNKNKALLDINKLTLYNQDKRTTKHIQKLLCLNNLDSNECIAFSKFEKQYYRLIADDGIKHIQPALYYSTNSKSNDLNLRLLKQYPILLEIGGNLSSRPISTGFVSLGYQRFKRIGTKILGNFYFGKLYTSGLLSARFDFPTRKIFAIQGNVIYNQYDFFRSSNIFTRNEKPSFLILNEINREGILLFPTSNNGIFAITNGYANLINRYFQSVVYSNADTTDVSNFNFFHSAISFEKNSLNKKQFANSGTMLLLKLSYIAGEEKNKPGNTFRNPSDINSILGFYRKYHNWLQLRFVYDTYLKQRGKFRFGIYTEAVARLNTRYLFDGDTNFNVLNKQYFANYTATQLVSPSFAPIPEANTFFLNNFRANQFIAFGLKTLYKLPLNIDLRAEAYVFQPVFTIKPDLNNKATNSTLFETRKYMASVALVYNSPIGPLALSMNYYDKFDFKNQNFSILFTAGYLLFNKKALD